MTQDDDPSGPAEHVRRAIELFLVDPAGMGGIWLRARPGPVRDAVLGWLAPLDPRRVPAQMDDATLDGGLDLAATLTTGRVVTGQGVLAGARPLIVATAERMESGVAARIGHAVDRGGPAVVLLDEGAAEDEAPPPGLIDRIALALPLDTMSYRDLVAPDPARVAAARKRLSHIETPPDLAEALVRIAASLGVASLRAPLRAMAAARALAALDGLAAPGEAQVAQAARLVYAHRAAPLPDEAPPDEAPPPDPTEPPPPGDDAGAGDPADDRVIDGVRTAMPEDLSRALAAMARSRARPSGAGGGERRRGGTRGRPLPSRPGAAGRGRVDVLATLRAAAPMQRMRARPEGGAIVAIRPDDIRLRRYETRADRLVILCVDASGSTALARLAEAKGLAETLLATAYESRDHVAVIAFRGQMAELALPPTRSLARAKARLAGLPAGGGTPLAAGLQAALDLIEQSRRRGMTPALVLFTDGRANIALDGTADRAQAGGDAERLARIIAAHRPAGAVVDTGRRQGRDMRALAQALGLPGVSLGRAGDGAGAVADAL